MPKTVRVVLCALFLAALIPTAAFAADRVPSDLKPGADAYRSRRTANVSRSLAAVVTTAEPDAWEDGDDSRATAPLLPWIYGELVEDHTLDSVDDVDHHVLRCSMDTLYRIETISDIDTKLEIRDYDTKELLGWFDDKSSTDLGSLGHYENRSTTSTKKVYVVVMAANPANGVGSYRLVVTPSEGYYMPGEVNRIGGANRFAVAVNTGKAMYGKDWGLSDGYPITDVIVVNGEDRAMADPLAASALAGMYRAPILSVTSNALPGDTAAAIKTIKAGNGGKVRIHVFGGTGSVSPAVYTALGKLRGSGSIERISGTTRYELAAKIADRVDQLWVRDMGRHAPVVLVANGENPKAFSDALAASAICNRMGWPMLLTQYAKVPGPTATRLGGVFKDSNTAIVNSTAYVSAGVYNAVKHEYSSRMTVRPGVYESAVDIALWAMERDILSSYEVVLVNKLSDALAAGTYTGWYGGVLLYTDTSGSYTATMRFIDKRASMIRWGTIVGGPASISAPTFNRLRTTLDPNL